jgi:putative Mg2+ transporter-C (MgtC) family protein
MEDIFHFTVMEEIEMAARLVLAAILGGAVGFERRQAEKPAGVRTLALVSMGSALFTLISAFGFGLGDPSRIAAQVVTGIGFLGAGTIMRIGADVRGLTTAASIWLVAAVGMAAGTGMYILSVVGAVLALTIIHFFPRRQNGS